MKIYLSTGGFQNKSPSEIARIFKKNDISNIEISGGKFELSLFKKINELYKKDTSIMLHNYFPYYKRFCF